MSDRDILIERVAGAWRGRNADGELQAHAAWHDLDDSGRLAAYSAAFALRQIEAALDKEGLSTTARAVLAAIERAG